LIGTTEEKAFAISAGIFGIRRDVTKAEYHEASGYVLFLYLFYFIYFN